MRPDLELTSVPGWAIASALPAADLTGRSWTIIAFGPRAADVARDWVAQIAAAGRESAVRRYELAEWDDLGEGPAALRADLAGARVGWRLMMAGPADACLGLRGVATILGIAEDEMTIATTDVGSRAVHCVHCGAVTRARVQLDEVLPCQACGRKLLVYHHVSRHSGAYMGFMVDAEEPVGLSS
ncbi:MAG: dimethylamine monooxygenase subunit DmmA family protein [Mycobacterium sp.]